MSKFDAGTAVEELEYDFTKYGGGSGTIPEPTTQQLDEFMGSMSAVFTEYRELTGKNLEDATEADLAEVADKIGGKIDAVLSSLGAGIAAFCSGTPSVEDYERLPFRVQQAFVGWLMEQFRPEGGASASKN